MSEGTPINELPNPTTHAAAPPVMDAPPTTEGAEAPVVKTRGDSARDAIYARRSAERAAPGDASEEAMRAAVAMHSGQENEPAQQPEPTRDPRGRFTSHQPAAEPAAAAPLENSPPAPLAQTGELVTLTIEGREMTVPLADVVNAGVATLQKQSTADARLQRASLAEQAIAARAAELDRRAQEIAANRQLPSGAAAASGNGLPPTGGETGPDDLEAGLDKLLDSDVPGAKQAISGFIAKQVQKALQASAPQGAPTAATPAAEPMATPWTKAEIDAANAKFAKIYGDQLQDPAFAAAASARIQAEMAQPIHRIARTSLEDIGLKVCADLLASRTAYPQSFAQPAGPGTGVADELAGRRQLAMRVPVPPANGQPRSTANPNPAPSMPSNSAWIEQVRAARGQAPRR